MKLFFLIITLLISGCLQTYERTENIKNVKVIPSKQDESLFLIKKTLEDKFSFNGNPDYNLYISIVKKSEAGGLTSEAYSASFTSTITVKYTLYSVQEKKNVFSSAVSKSTNYVSERGKFVAEKVGEKAVFENLSIRVSEEIYEQIQDGFLNIYSNKNASPSN
jgi:hypothetical protein